MKTKRTIRTMRRHGLYPKIIGFAGFNPNGKYIAKLAKYMRAERRLSDSIAATHPGWDCWIVVYGHNETKRKSHDSISYF